MRSAGFLADAENVDGLTNTIEGAGDALSTAGDIVGALSPLIGIAAKNSELFGLALQIIAVRMIAIKAIGFASAIAAMIAKMSNSRSCSCWDSWNDKLQLSNRSRYGGGHRTRRCFCYCTRPAGSSNRGGRGRRNFISLSMSYG